MSGHTKHFILHSLPRTPATRLIGLVYFVPGNPGLVEYYDTFFQQLRDSLESDVRQGGDVVSLDVYGTSLAGFHDDDHEPFSASNPPFTLEDQIEKIYVDLGSKRPPEEEDKREPSSTRHYDFVIVMGHSVGSYIALEVFHRHMHDPSRFPNLHLHHGILLFPTITHIAQSPSGKALNRLRTTPLLDKYAHTVASTAASFLPRSVVEFYCRTIMSFTPAAASATADFVGSRDGIWQALHMGKDEMRCIGEEKWAEALWEVPREAEAHRRKVPKFFFLFGKSDHWVDDVLRDEFLERRRVHGVREGPEYKRGMTEVYVDELGRAKHAFCTREGKSIFSFFPLSYLFFCHLL
jgi:pimeloyl-ACP methyl ester carboxylesterase